MVGQAQNGSVIGSVVRRGVWDGLKTFSGKKERNAWKNYGSSTVKVRG